jgi:hypothetical protein
VGSAFEGKGITDGEIYTHIDIDIGGTSRFFLNKAREKKREHEAPQWRWRADKATAKKNRKKKQKTKRNDEALAWRKTSGIKLTSPPSVKPQDFTTTKLWRWRADKAPAIEHILQRTNYVENTFYYYYYY